MRTITLEEHFVTEGFLKATGAYDEASGMGHVREKLLDIGDVRLQAMDESGIDLQVLSLAAIGVDKLRGAEESAVLRDVNDELAAAVRRHPGRFAGFATLPMKDPAAAAKELQRCIDELKFVGVMINGTTDGVFLDDSRFTPVWEAAHALGVPVYLHPAEPPEAVMQAYYSGLPEPMGHLLSIAGWGWHSETALHSLRLIVSGLFDRMPELRMIIGHMGEGLPFALARSSAVLSGAAKHLQRPVDRTFLDQFHITTSGYFTRPPFECAEAVLGVERMMFSIDYPFSPNTKGREFLSSLMIDSEDRERLTHRNAEQVLKLS
jgi:uncharacterized protein